MARARRAKRPREARRLVLTVYETEKRMRRITFENAQKTAHHSRVGSSPVSTGLRGSPLMTLRQPATAILTVTMVVVLSVLASSPSLHAQQLRQTPRAVPLITRVTDREDACNNQCGRPFCEQCMADGNYCVRDQDNNILNWGGNNLNGECQAIWDNSYTCWNHCMGR